MMRITPATRISFGLMSLTISLLLVGKIIGIAPDRTSAVVESRKTLSESLAIQFSVAAQQGDLALIKETLNSMVERENDIKSAAIRDASGTLIAAAGDHFAHWQGASDGKSTPTQVQVPIFRGQEKWATIELSFPPLWVNNITSGLKNSYLSLILFMCFAGFVGNRFIIKRTLRELDPSKVIPGRVQAAFDVLKESVLILDEKEQVVLANKAFADLVDRSAAELIGFKGSELGWKGFNSPTKRKSLPWMQVLSGKSNMVGVRIEMERKNGMTIALIANAAPVLDGKGKRRGVLVTLDNVTEIEMKNQELNQVVNKLQETTDVVQNKNKELEFLAAHDPLTLLLNRRALNRRFDEAFTQAQTSGSTLSCVMCDIDHFKSVNDRYGHATGDKVIKMIAALLQKNFREQDLVGRYGGEEFCIVLPDVDIKLAGEICERIRKNIKDDTDSGVQVTASFGVAALNAGVQGPVELANQADKALYIAKESGRNRVVCWGDEEAAGFTDQAEVGSGTREEEDEREKLSEDHPETNVKPEEVKHLNRRLQELAEIAEKRTAELEHFTAYDQATGLPTRTLFHDRISQALMRGRRYDNIVAILAISVDAVERVSEALGYQAGEQLFNEISKRMSKILRSMDTVAKLPADSLTPTIARLGHDDFGVLLTDIKEVNAITWIVKRILNALQDAFIIDGKEIYTATNIGVSIYPYDGENPEELERNAAAAKTHARTEIGSNNYFFFSRKIQSMSIKHLEVENNLHRAIDNDEFVLHYQPKINTHSGEIIGVEALIRWQCPDKGLISPFEFIRIAEYSGLISQIGDWVLKEACKQVRVWLDMGIDNCSVAVNFSNKQFRQKNLTQKIMEALEANLLLPEHLVVEVTENSMMENIKSSTIILNEIGEKGIGIALDDFGTGYSSLGYLKNFPVTHVKIDRSFIADIDSNEKDAILVKSIIRMAHGMKLKVTAEGIENEKQVDMLYNLGCDEMQGYLFSKPVSAGEITKLFQQGINRRIKIWQEDRAA